MEAVVGGDGVVVVVVVVLVEDVDGVVGGGGVDISITCGISHSPQKPLRIGCAGIPRLSILQRCWSSLKAASSTEGASDRGRDHNLSAAAEALGQSRGKRLVASTYSPHIAASPPNTSFFCSSVPWKSVGSHL